MADPNVPSTPPLGGFGTLPALPGLSLLNGLFDFASPGFGTAASPFASGQLANSGQGPVAYGPTAAAGIPAASAASCLPPVAPAVTGPASRTT